MRTFKQIEIISTRYVASLPFNESLKEQAKKLRRTSTLSEVLFWMQINKKKFYGLDFDRLMLLYIEDSSEVILYFSHSCNASI